MLWARSDLATLRSCATGYTHFNSRHSGPIKPERWTLRFPSAEPTRLKDGTLKRTYIAKPLVAPSDKPVFGELAVLECLQRDGWSGVWVDTYHGTELFWRDMPQRSSKVDLFQEPEALNVYRGIVAEHGKRGGFFDVFAWRETYFLFVEYKGKGDRSNANERSWIEAAIRYGIDPGQLLIVEYSSLNWRGHRIERKPCSVHASEQ